jgi:hypothetical protein
MKSVLGLRALEDLAKLMPSMRTFEDGSIKDIPLSS